MTNSLVSSWRAIPATAVIALVLLTSACARREAAAPLPSLTGPVAAAGQQPQTKPPASAATDTLADSPREMAKEDGGRALAPATENLKSPGYAEDDREAMQVPMAKGARDRAAAVAKLGAATPQATAEPDFGGAYGEPEMPESVPVFGGLPQPANNTERYQHIDDNPLKVVANDPVSTFSLDVDTGSYSNVRRFLAAGNRPPEDAVRVEELVNYFPYDYPRGTSSDPFGVRTELAPCPWQHEHWLMRVAVRADDVAASAMPAANLVFLVDVSGSMDEPAKLPLLRSSLKLLIDQLRGQDRVSLVVYAGREAVVLEPTAGDQHDKIARAIDELSAGGSTAGEAGIRAAYRMARSAFIKGGINRVLLATDGDFNVGITDFQQLKDLVSQERETGVQLSTLGFGTGNYNEQNMEQLADSGNGSYAYIDTLTEGRKVLVDQMRSTLVTVAKDVKIQVEFNPTAISEYRLIGYENRVLAREDFNNDRVDAGDVGAGQSVTALYELTPVGAAPSVDPLRYGSDAAKPVGEHTATSPNEVAFVKVRYKQPSASESKLMEVPVEKAALLASFDAAGDDFRFATAVAGFGQLLRGGKRTATWNWDDVLATATASRGKDEFGYRSEFLSLVRMAKISG